MDANDRRQRAASEAAEWWLRIEDGDMSLEERGAFVDWLRESSVHVGEMLHIAQIHGSLAEFQQWERIDTDGPEPLATVVPLSAGIQRPDEPSVERVDHATRRWQFGAALAAVFVAAVAMWWALSANVQSIETSQGERREITLADGSVLQVDPQTRLQVRFEQHTRRVSLERGRALFRVAKDAQRPFFVRADATVVRAVGTQFGVERASSGIVITVAEGKVAVGPEQPARADAEMVLVAGQQVVVQRGGSAAPVRRVDSLKELAWAHGRLVFEKQSVAEVIAEFNRYNFVQLHVEDPQLARTTISGVFDASQPESFIGFMQSVASVRVDRQGKDITISLAL